MKLSNLRNLNICRSDSDNAPYVFIFECKIDGTEILIVSRKENGKWECHYCSHASKRCEICGSVDLYSDCKHFTKLVQENYKEVTEFIRKGKNA